MPLKREVVSDGSANLDERELVARAQKDSVSAFSVLVERYRTMVYSRARELAGNDADAEDACQETFLV